MKKLFTTMVLLLALVLVGKAQIVLLDEDFNNGFPTIGTTPDTWLNIDADGDTYVWGNFRMAGHGGSNDSCATSKSYDSQATPHELTPDNWLITPAITIPADAEYAELSFWVCAQDASYAAEHYGVYVTTNSNYSNVSNYTCLFEETLDANGGPRAQGAWKRKTANLHAYAGQTIHIAFRHFNVTDMFYINLDDIKVEVLTGPTVYASPENIQFPSGQAGSNFGRKEISVSGVMLSGNVTVSVPAPFGISTDTNATYSNTLTLTPNNGTLASTPIYVNFNPTTVGYYNENITVASSGANACNVSVKGLAINCGQSMPIPWYEDFATEDFPTNCWTVTSTDTADYENDEGQVYPGYKYYTWYNDNESPYAAVIGDHKRFQNEHLYTPVFNLNNVTGAASFEFDFRTNPRIDALIEGGVRFTLEMSTDGGNTYNTVWNVADIREAFDEYWTGWSDIWPVSIDMDQYLGTNTNIKFDFHYEADSGAADQIIIQNVRFSNFFEPRMDVMTEDTIYVFTYVGNPESVIIPVEGRNLNSTISVTTTSPFEVSADGNTFATTATLPARGGNLYARFNPTTAVVGASANIAIVNNYTDATGTYPNTTFSKTIVINGNSYNCSGVVLPITESFESEDSTVLAPNTTEYCWSAFKGNTRDAQNDIVNSNDYAYTGSKSLRFSSIKYNAQQVYDQYLISPELNATNPMLVMFNYANASALKDETFRVGYSTTGNAVSDFTWENDIVNAANTDWHLYRNANVPANVKYVAVQYKSQFKAYLYIDNFQIMEAPACLFPVELRAENTNANSANIAWTAGSNETSWEIAYSTAPWDLNAATTVPASSTTATLSGLTANTHYQMAVRANCGGGHSEWSEIADFWTTTIPATIPYTQTFEDNDADRGNWVFVNGGQPNYFMYGTTNNWQTGKLLIITKDGSSHSYLTTVGTGDDQVKVSHYSTVWAYRDIEFPTTTAYGYLITLDWKCFGEEGYDFGELFIGNATGVTNFDRNESHPGFVDVNTAHYVPAGLTKLDRYFGTSQKKTSSYLIPAENVAGTVQRLYFLWTNDSLSGAEQPLGVDNINISIPQFASMTGTVTDDQTGAAIPNATISLVSNQGFTVTGTTDANGQYTIENIVVGFYSITVKANGYYELNTGYSLAEGSNTNNFQLTVQECAIIPTGVTATIEDINVILTWNAIESGIMTQATSESTAGSLGTGTPNYRMEAYHLFNSEYLTRYNGCTIDNVSFIFNSNPAVCTYTIRIHIGEDPTGQFGPASVLYERQIDPSEILDLNTWNTYAIDPIVIDASQPLWIGYKAEWENASGNDAYPCTMLNSLNTGFGDVMFFNNSWQTSEYNDWAIRANAVAPDYHYNIVEDGVVIANNISGAEYVVSPGDPTACYQLQTVCENGQISSPSDCATISVGINNVESNLTFTVYPNPAHETVTVSTTMDVQKVEVMNYLGQVIFSQNTTNNNFTLNVANYADGVYFIRLSGNDGIATQKLIKK